MNAPSRAGLPALPLKDPKLFREQCYIDGAWTGAAKTFPVHNPASGAQLGTVPDMGAEETTKAIAAADAALPAWRAKTGKERAAILRKWNDLILANLDDLALILTSEQGKPLAESKGEITIGAAYVEWFAEEAKRIYGDTIPTPWADRRIVVIKQPIGVCAAITPWNFPHSMITRKVAPGLAAGCCVILKPAEQTPYSALALAELAERAGFPKGVLNIITGDAPAIGGELCANPTVRKISFTGSTEVGRLLMKQAAPTVKKISLELGGNAPFIVFDDADLDAAVEGAMVSKYRNTGQTCVCANRLFVQDGVYDEFAAKLAAEGEGAEGRRRHRGGRDPGAADRHEGAGEGGRARRRRARQGRARRSPAASATRWAGTYYEPTVLTDVKPDDEDLPRGDLRPGGAAVPLQDRRRGDRTGQPHRVRPGVVLLQPRHRPHLARRGSARVRHGRRQ